MIKKTTAFYVVLVGSLASFMAAYTSNAVTTCKSISSKQYFAKLDNKPLFINNGCIKCPLRKNLCPKRT